MNPFNKTEQKIIAALDEGKHTLSIIKKFLVTKEQILSIRQRSDEYRRNNFFNPDEVDCWLCPTKNKLT